MAHSPQQYTSRKVSYHGPVTAHSEPRITDDGRLEYEAQLSSWDGEGGASGPSGDSAVKMMASMAQDIENHLVDNSPLSLQGHNKHLLSLLVNASRLSEAQIAEAKVREIIISELHHRAQNVLAVVMALARQCFRHATSLEQAKASFYRSLMAIANTHDLLLQSQESPSLLYDVAEKALGAYNSLDKRINISVGKIRIPVSFVLPITLLLGELGTNAAKYGSLSESGGRVELTGSSDDSSGLLSLRWAEYGGPVVSARVRSGQGSRLLEETIPHQLGGSGFMDFARLGLVYTLCVPIPP